MSHIFDALNKQKGTSGPRPTPAGPLSPAASSSAPLPDLIDPIRDREFEALRQRLLLELGSDHSPTVVFTGSVPGEGATTLALHFARGLAETDRGPVLLADSDFGRHPGSLTGALERSGDPRPGLGEFLAGQVDLTTAVVGTEHPLLHFLPCGRLPGQPLELLRPESLQRAVREMGRHYSFVVFDAAPPLTAAETGMLAAGTDGVVLVVRANRVRREIAQRAVHLMTKARCRLLGVVLNDRRYPIPGFLYRRI